MSYLDNQLSAFKNSVSSSSSRLSTKRIIPPSSSDASQPVSGQSSKATEAAKRKRPETTTSFSQPADTGTGRNIMTQVTYAIEYLKTKGMPQSLDDLFSYLSIQHRENDYKRTIGTILMNHEKVEYESKSGDKEATFRFRPLHNIRSKETLQAFLQSQPTARGLSVREVKDGWPGAETAIDELEAESKILVTRNRKDNHPKMIWANDASLDCPVDDEFHAIWLKIKLPEAKTLAEELEKVGLTPASKSKGTNRVVKQEVKKIKKPRRGGKTTNTHMIGILRDYSHLKR